MLARPPRSLCRLAAMLLTLPAIAGVCSCAPSGGGALDAPLTLSGEMEAASLTIPEGHVTTVTDDLLLRVRGDVIIDGDLIAQSRFSSGPGISIEIVAEGDITINGSVIAGDGLALPDGLAKTLTTQTGDLVLSGGDLVTCAGGDLTIGRNATLISGNGADSANLIGTPSSITSGDDGGHIVLACQRTLRLRGSLYIGNGGLGGQVFGATPDQLIQAPDGHGGDSGALYMAAGTFDVPGMEPSRFVISTVMYSADATTATIDGGLGGLAGSMTIIGGEGQTGQDEFLFGTRGGNGYIRAGDAGFIALADETRRPTGEGRGWVIEGGDGGDAFGWPTEFSTNGNCFPVLIHNLAADAGHGGPITVTAGNGRHGTSGNANGEDGGELILIGGNGGSAFVADRNLYLGNGGDGGLVSADGCYGGDGYSGQCDPAGNGANGGRIEARGGNGGDGGQPGEGGEAEADSLACRAGSGGVGRPPGDAGEPGTWFLANGDSGRGVDTAPIAGATLTGTGDTAGNGFQPACN